MCFVAAFVRFGGTSIKSSVVATKNIFPVFFSFLQMYFFTLTSRKTRGGSQSTQGHTVPWRNSVVSNIRLTSHVGVWEKIVRQVIFRKTYVVLLCPVKGTQLRSIRNLSN